MKTIHPIAQTDDTVTLGRADFEMMLEAVEDAEDIIALRTADAREKEVGKDAARADHLPVDLTMRLMDGEHPVRIWREHRRLSPQALADKAGIGRSYLVEIEGCKKPGSVAAYRRMASALEVAIDDLLSSTDLTPNYLQLRLTTAKAMAESHGINPKLFRQELRRRNPHWHSRYGRWTVVIDSDEHALMKSVLDEMNSEITR